MLYVTSPELRTLLALSWLTQHHEQPQFPASGGGPSQLVILLPVKRASSQPNELPPPQPVFAQVPFEPVHLPTSSLSIEVLPL